MALRPGTAIVVPTKPAGQAPTTAVAPAPTPTSDAAPETAPATTSNVRPTTAAPAQHTEPKDPLAHADDPATRSSQSAAPAQHTEPNDPPGHAEDPATKASQGAAGNANNQWPLPPVNTQAPTTTNALSVLLLAMSSKAQADAAAHTSHGSGNSDNGQQHAGSLPSDSSGDHSGSKDPGGAEQGGGSGESHAQPADDPPGSKSQGGTGHEGANQDGNSQSGHGNSNGETHPKDSSHSDDLSDGIDPGTPANGDQATVTWKHDGQTFTAVSSNGAVIVQGKGAKSTLAAGATATFEGQVLDVPSAVDAIIVDGAAASFTFPAGSGNDQGDNDPPTATFTESGRVFTAAVQGSSILLEAGGSTTMMAYGARGTFAGRLVSMPSYPGIDAININGKSFTLQAGSDDEKEASAQTQLAAVLTEDGKTFTAILQGASSVVLEAASTTLTIPPGAVATLDGEVFSVPTAGSIVVHDGTTITLTPTALSTQPSNAATVTNHAGQSLSAFDFGSSVIVISGSSTITLADGAQTTIGKNTLSAASTGGAIVVNGTSTLAASTRTNIADPSTSDGSGAETTGVTGLGSEGAASSDRSPVWTSMVLLLGSWSFVMWLR